MAARSTFHLLLAGVDEDGQGDHALVAAERIRSIRDVKLELVHVLEPAARGAQEGVERALAAAKRVSKRLADVEESNGLRPGTLSDRLKIQHGEPGQVLTEKALEGPADAVFLGPYTKKGLLEPGSAVRTVLEGTRCCVWLQPCPVAEVRRVLLAFDGSPASVQALDLACRVAVLTGARLTILHCLERPREQAQRELEHQLEDVDWEGVQHELVVTDEKPLEGVLGRQADADLIVLGTRGHSGLKRALLGSLAHEVARSAKKPVLVVPRPAM